MVKVNGWLSSCRRGAPLVSPQLVGGKKRFEAERVRCDCRSSPSGAGRPGRFAVTSREHCALATAHAGVNGPFGFSSRFGAGHAS